MPQPREPPFGCLAQCCCLSMLGAVSFIAFFWLHGDEADGRTARAPLFVFAPPMVFALAVLMALLASRLTLPPHLQPGLRTAATWGLGALATLAVCVRLATEAAPLFSWAAAIAPLALLLVIRAATAPPLDGFGVFVRAVPRIELLLYGAAVALLYWRLASGATVDGASSDASSRQPPSWWAIAGPALAQEGLVVGAALTALVSAARPVAPPVGTSDRAEWVRRREEHAVCGGVGGALAAWLRLALLSAVTSQLSRTAAAAADQASSTLPPPTATWRAAYAPFVMLLGLGLSCCACCLCCALALPTAPSAAGVVAPARFPAAHKRGNGNSMSETSSCDGRGDSEALLPRQGVASPQLL